MVTTPSSNDHYGCEWSEVGSPLGRTDVQGVWNKQTARLSSNARELKAVQMAFKAFDPALIENHVQVLSSNIPTMSYINKQVGTRVVCLLSIADDILGWA